MQIRLKALCCPEQSVLTHKVTHSSKELFGLMIIKAQYIVVLFVSFCKFGKSLFYLFDKCRLFQFIGYPCGIIRKTAVEIFVGKKELLPFSKILMQIPYISCYFLTIVAGSRIYDIL